MTNRQPMTRKATTGNGASDGQLYIQTNEIQNAIIHYHRSADGTLAEIERVPTGGTGSGTYKPISGQESAPNAFEGAGSIILTPDERFLFTTNGGDNSVSCFGVDADGGLTLLDCKPTGNAVTGRSGTAKSLAYAPSTNTLYVLHSFGPDHIRLMSVGEGGKLTVRPEGYSANTHDKQDRVATMATLSPDERFLFVGTTFDQPPTANPDGSPILWITGADGLPKSIASNNPDPNGLVVFPVGPDGALDIPSFHDAHGGSPFYIAFLHNRPDTFVIGYAVGNGVAMGTMDGDGQVTIGQVAQIDTSVGLPSELCWLAVSPDDRRVFSANFGYSYVSSFNIDGTKISVAQDPAGPKVPGDGTFRALDGVVSSGPNDNWISPDGAYLYQIYPNASKLVGYAVQSNGSLEEITVAHIPYNSPQGLVGV